MQKELRNIWQVSQMQSDFTEHDVIYMKRAIELAKLGVREATPNPLVGCVIVKDGKIISEGWHHKYGSDHAEADAVKKCGESIEGASVYVTLEPCSHYGKTPPCAKLLAERRPKEVVIAMGDPNPKVNGRGIEILKDAGIKVRMPLLEKECRYLNRGFLSRIVRGRPWVTVKSAVTLDGRIALPNGESKWITGGEARLEVQKMRAENDALLTGVGTIAADDPQMTVRDVSGRNPLRVIVDPRLRMPENAKIFGCGDKVIVFCDFDAPEGKIARFEAKGAEIVRVDFKSACPMTKILSNLGENGINYLMVEAGAKTVSSFFAERLADEFVMFAAPKIAGKGLGFAEYFEIPSLSETVNIKNLTVDKCGEDLKIKGVAECSRDWLKL